MPLVPTTPPHLAAGLVAAAVLALGAWSGESRAGEEWVLEQAAELHQSPAAAARVLRRLEAGQRVESHGARGGWVHVSVAGSADEPVVTGWIPGPVVRPDASESSIHRSEGR